MGLVELSSGEAEFKGSHVLYFDVTADDIRLETYGGGTYVLLKIKFTRYLTWYVMSMFIPTLTMVIASEGTTNYSHCSRCVKVASTKCKPSSD